MAENVSTAAQATPPPESPESKSPATPATPQAAAPKTEDSVYDDALHLLEESLDNSAAAATPQGEADGSPDKAATSDLPSADDWDPLAEEAEANQETETPSSDGGQTPQLSEDQARLLSRLHMSPEQLAGWTPQQRDEFFANATKRESDQTSSFTSLKNEIQRLEQKIEQQADPTKTADEPTEDTSGDDAGVDEEVAKVLQEAVASYGEEIKPLADLTASLNKKVVASEKALLTANGTIEEQRKRTELLSHIMSEQAVDLAMRDLVSEYPSLDKADARKQVRSRFDQHWRSESNPHRKEGVAFMDQLRATMKDAAAAEFGNVTESAAQVALANKTKERLRSQPKAGKGRERPRPKTEDDVYNDAFDEFLKNDL